MVGSFGGKRPFGTWLFGLQELLLLQPPLDPRAKPVGLEALQGLDVLDVLDALVAHQTVAKGHIWYANSR